jgi:hypothetical protein
MDSFLIREQIVLEVEGGPAGLAEAKSILEPHGFHLHVDDRHSGGYLSFIYARRT